MDKDFWERTFGDLYQTVDLLFAVPISYRQSSVILTRPLPTQLSGHGSPLSAEFAFRGVDSPPPA